MQPSLDKTTDESLVMAILELSGILNRRGTNVTAGLGLTTQQWQVLLYLSQDPNIPSLEAKQELMSERGWLASELATAMHVSRPYITNLVNALLDKKFIESMADERDQRKKYLNLTDEGRLAVAKLQPYRKEANRRLFEGIGEGEKEQMLRTLSVCMGNLHEPMDLQ